MQTSLGHFGDANQILFLPPAEIKAERSIYVSLLDGHDNPGCGSIKRPCRTIVRAVEIAAWGDRVYIDGSGTEQQPYDCKSRATRRVDVKVSLDFEGYKSAVFVKCTGGIYFEGQDTGGELHITLANITFSATPIIFKRSSNVEIKNCGFQDNARRAIEFRATPLVESTSFLVKKSTFEDNGLCVYLDFTGTVASGIRATVRIENTTFHGNTRGGNPGRAGGVLITSTTGIEGLLPISVACKNIVYNKNRGPFITLQISAAISSEYYSNMEFVGNEATLGKVYKKGFWGSLYVSRTKFTNASFVNIRCKNNDNIRCFGIASEETQIKIQGSVIAHQKVEDYGGGLYISEADKSVRLDVADSSFVNCSAREGGAIHVDNGKGSINFMLRNASFVSCNATVAGSAVIIGGYTRAKTGGEGIQVLSTSIENVTVSNCFTGDRKHPNQSSDRDFGAMSFTIGKRGRIQIKDSKWTNNSAPSCATVSVSTREELDLDVTGSQFVKNFSPKRCVFCVAYLMSASEASGTVRLHGNIISESSLNALCLSPLFRIVVTDVIVSKSEHAALVIKLHSGTLARTVRPYDAKALVKNCTLIGNPVNVLSIMNNTRSVEFSFRDSSFVGGSSVQIKREQPIPYNFYLQTVCARKTTIRALIVFVNVTFDSANPTQLDIRCKGNKTVLVKNSVFKHSTIRCLTQTNGCSANGDDVQLAGAVTMLFRRDNAKNQGCVSKRNPHNTHPTWTYESFAVFEDTTFQNNEGLLAGAVYVVNGYTLFRGCRFKNNFALRRGGHVSLPSGTGEVEFASSTMLQTTDNSRAERTAQGPTYFQFLYSESTGPLIITNSTLLSNVSTTEPHPILQVTQGGYVFLHPTSQINCSVGNKLTFENNTHFIGTYTDQSCQINLTVLSYTCGLCPPGTYSLENGYTSGFHMEQGVRCLPCPYGATCLRNVLAKPNFYGYIVSRNPPALNFSSCPEEYCSPPHTEDTSVYNGCHGNRTGVLCGRCRAGFTESLFTRECREASECGQPWFWLLGVVVLVLLSGYLVFKPPLFQKLYVNIFWWKSTSTPQAASSEMGGTNAPPPHSGGYLKIAFYFYQVADILLVYPVSQVSERFPIIIPIVGMFTFQVRAFDHKFGCPLTSLSVVAKELFLSLGFFVVLLCIALIYLGHHIISHFSNRIKKPHAITYWVVAMETLLLGYETLAETSLKLLQCVRIGAEWRLFHDGNVRCLQWWQYIFLAYSVGFLLPFIGVLFSGTRLLAKRKIPAKEFLLACVLPLPLLLRWLWLHVCKKQAARVEEDEEERMREEVAEVLYGPFQRQHLDGLREQDEEPSAYTSFLRGSMDWVFERPTSGPVHWESVLIGRRLLLLSLHSFIPNLMVRLTCMTAACMLITVHHVLTAPYQNRKANALETTSLISLTFLGVMNLSQAAFSSTGVAPGGSAETFFVILEHLELFLLGFVPGVFVILVIAAVVSQIIRCLNFLVRCILSVKFGSHERGYTRGTEREPLLTDSINSQS